MQYEAMFAHSDASPHSRMLGPILKHVRRFTLELNLKIIYEFYNFARAGFENPICNFHTCDLFI